MDMSYQETNEGLLASKPILTLVLGSPVLHHTLSIDIASLREVKYTDSYSMLNQKNYSYIQLSQLILCNVMLVISQDSVTQECKCKK